MWDKYMVIATLSAIIGVVLGFISLLQATELSLRYGVTWGMLICAVIFLWAFLSLGERSRS